MDRSLKKPLRKEITDEGKEEGLMALDKKNISGMGKSPPNISEIQEEASAVFAWSSDPR